MNGKEFMKADISKFYILGVGVICLLLVGAYFSYAMFTVSKEKSNAISIVTGNLTYKLLVDGEEGNTLTVPEGTTKEFIITLSNPNNRVARFNFYYIGDLQDGVTVGYVPVKGVSTPPDEKGINLEISGTSGSSSTYRIQVKNSFDSEITITLGIGVGLDYNDLSLPSNGHLFNEIELDEGAKKVLANNELQEETTNMFNYASNGNYLDMSSGPQNNPEYVTNGLYSIEDEDGTSYYFRGNVNNNNVQFGEYTSDYYVYQGNNTNIYQSESSCTEAGNSSCTQVKLASAGDKMYWKIVRINGDGSLRLIYNGTSVTPDFSDLAHSYAIGKVPYNLESNDPKYTGYTYDNGTDSFIKKEVDTWYKNTLGSSGYDSKVSSGRFCSDSSGYKTASEYGFSGMDFNVFASYDRLGQSATNYAKPNAPVLNCPSTSEIYGGSYRLKAGLITADELVLAGSLPYMGGENDSYLAIGTNNMAYWSMTPANFVDGDAGVWYGCDILDGTVGGYYAVRPVINVTTENGFTSGDGTVENIYVLSLSNGQF